MSCLVTPEYSQVRWPIWTRIYDTLIVFWQLCYNNLQVGNPVTIHGLRHEPAPPIFPLMSLPWPLHPPVLTLTFTLITPTCCTWYRGVLNPSPNPSHNPRFVDGAEGMWPASSYTALSMTTAEVGVKISTT